MLDLSATLCLRLCDWADSREQGISRRPEAEVRHRRVHMREMREITRWRSETPPAVGGCKGRHPRRRRLYRILGPSVNNLKIVLRNYLTMPRNKRAESRIRIRLNHVDAKFTRKQVESVFQQLQRYARTVYSSRQLPPFTKEYVEREHEILLGVCKQVNLIV